MNVFAEVERESEIVQRISTVARCSSMPCFGDLLWDIDGLDPSSLMQNPGVMFETSKRVAVFQEIAGELRYYAGGWCLHQNQRYEEEERIWAEGSEQGVFATIHDALAFTEQYLVDESGFKEIAVPRQIRYSR